MALAGFQFICDQCYEVMTITDDGNYETQTVGPCSCGYTQAFKIMAYENANEEELHCKSPRHREGRRFLVGF